MGFETGKPTGMEARSFMVKCEMRRLYYEEIQEERRYLAGKDLHVFDCYRLVEDGMLHWKMGCLSGGLAALGLAGFGSRMLQASPVPVGTVISRTTRVALLSREASTQIYVQSSKRQS